MPVAQPPIFEFEATYVRDLEGLYVPWQAATAPEPRLLALNEDLAAELGLNVEALRTPEGAAMLVGNAVPAGAVPVAQAYAGHQFGGYSPRLGDGRALLIGELIDTQGRRRDLHLKGSGRTPFARGADGKAAVGPMLREYVIGEAMHALGIPTSRALAVTATGERVARETALPGAVLARVAASHLRVGTFEFAVRSQDPELVRRLADYAIARHHPEAADGADRYLALLEAVIEVQASLVASWMLVGFIHGVMNTDNMAISGESIDYGPCAFMDAYDPATVFSSIDQAGRYAYRNQPSIAQWNLARLAESLLGLIDPDADVATAAATALLKSFPERYRLHWTRGMATKLGLAGVRAEDSALSDDLLAQMQAQGVDFTLGFRALAESLRGDAAATRQLFTDAAAFDAWNDRWLARLAAAGADLTATADAMDRVNPIYVPRNHKVEEALAAATEGDLDPLGQLLDLLADPYARRPGFDSYAAPAPSGLGAYRTYCGT